MAMNVGESPEESPEVPEPDLSMELQEEVRRCLTEHDCGCAKNEARIRRLRLLPDREENEVESLRETYAHAALIEMVTLLRSFDPDISQEKLSSDVHSILHSDAVWCLDAPQARARGRPAGHVNPQLKVVLRKYVPRSREEWLGPDIERHIAAKRAFFRHFDRKIRRTVGQVVKRMPQPRAPTDQTTAVRVAVLMGSGGALVFGGCGGTLGLCAGSSVGALVGSIPAPLTLGVSIPTGAAVGGGLGACTGALAGLASGFVCGGAAGGAFYVYRAEVRDGTVLLRSKGGHALERTRTKALETSGYLKVTAIETVDAVRTRVSDICQDGGVQAGVASAAGGAVVIGAAGSAVGVATGGVLGAACGTIPAIFTFGLSIPVGAALGSGVGFCAGALTGGTAGLLGGGTAGYTIYHHQEEISQGLNGAVARATGVTRFFADKASSTVRLAQAAFAAE